MNKVININLAGRLVPIDESAYHQLEDYLNRLKKFFQKEEGGDEIIRDMEDRIGELFQDKLRKGTSCIMTGDIQDVIEIMGSPEQIENETGEEDNVKESGVEAGSASSNKKKSLYRSRKDKIIGGVCGGLASYFHIDPVILRVATIIITLMWGTGLILYLLLWAVLPELDEEPQQLRRRLYRNPRQKVVGGVCSGIAAYANVDPVIPRVVFAAPLLGILFFGIINKDIFFFPLFAGGLPTLVLLYIILWASLPEATTVAEKLEMRGEKVDIQSLSQAIKEPAADNSSKRSGIVSLFAFLFKVFVFFVLGTILIAIAGVLIAVFAALLGLAMPPALTFPYSRLISESSTQVWILWVCLIIALIVPFIAIIRLLVRIISGRPRKGNKWVNMVQAFLFIAAVFGLFWIISSIAADFQASYRKTYTYTLNQPGSDTLLIKNSVLNKTDTEEDWDNDDDQHHSSFRFRNDSTISISNIRLNIVCSPDSAFHLKLQKCARGKNRERAKLLAEAITCHYYQDAETLYLPADFDLPLNHPFREQKLNIELQIPEGKVFQTDRLYHYHKSRKRVSKHGRVHINRNSIASWKDNRYYLMTANGAVVIDSTMKINEQQ